MPKEELAMTPIEDIAEVDTEHSMDKWCKKMGPMPTKQFIEGVYINTLVGLHGYKDISIKRKMVMERCAKLYDRIYENNKLQLNLNKKIR